MDDDGGNDVGNDDGNDDDDDTVGAGSDSNNNDVPSFLEDYENNHKNSSHSGSIKRKGHEDFESDDDVASAIRRAQGMYI